MTAPVTTRRDGTGATGPSEVLDLTRAQAGLWYAQQLQPGNPVFTIAQYLEVHGTVDAESYRRAWAQVVTEVDALRARFREGPDGPVQVVEPDKPFAFAAVDLRDEADPVAAATEWMREEQARAMDPADGPLLSVAVLRLRDDLTYCYQRAHHLTLDGYGAAMVVPRVLAVYEGDAPASPFTSLRDLVADDAAYAGSDADDADREFWRDRLADRPDPTLLAGRPSTMPERLVRRSVEVPAGVVTDLRSVARTQGGGLPPLLVAVVATWVSRLTGETDVVLSLPVTARRGKVAKRAPSMISNIVPLRLTVRPGTPLDALAGDASSELRRLLAHQRRRPEEIRADLGLDPSARLSGPSVNILPPQEQTALHGAPAVLHNLSVGPVDDLSVIVSDPGDGTLQVDLDATPELYDAEVLDAHLARLVNLLRAASGADEGAAVGALALATDADRATVTEFAQGGSGQTVDTTVPDLFEAQVLRSPTATALVSGPFRLSFADLDRLTNRAARELMDHEVGPGRTVAVALPRTGDLVISLLAVVKAGGAYLPIDPAYPDDRIAQMLDDARPNCVVTDSVTEKRLPAGTPTLVVDDPDQRDRLAERDDGRIHPHRAAPSDPAYVIYTSGSTGRPKGVVVEHASLTNLFAHHSTAVFAPAVAAVGGRRLRVAHISAVSFDASWDPVLWMLDGHELHFVGEDTRRDPEALVAHLGAVGADSVETTPTYADQLLEAGLLDAGVRVLCLGGEAVGDGLWRRLADTPDLLAFNFFGPAESTVDTVVARVCRHDHPVIGRPVGNTRAYVLDSGLAPVGVGVTGELYLAGAGLARGYLGQPERTAERFVPDPYGPAGERMYRTGDLARWGSDGALEFAGRIDDQVKVRGFRVELGEIDAVLGAHPAVTAAATTVRASDTDGGQGRLVSYVVPAGSNPLDPDELVAHAASTLPEHMVPALYVPLPTLPLTPNGKLDQAALPAPSEVSVLVPGRSAGRAPRTPTEELLAGMLAQALGLLEVGATDDFFALGGHSLMATRLVSRIRTTFGVELPMRALFEAPTVAGLAERIASADRPRPPLRPQHRPDPMPLSAAQRRLWFLDQLEPGSAAYNIPAVLHLSGPLDVEALRGALHDVVARHETLRTVYPAPDGEPRQRVLDAADPAVEAATALPVGDDVDVRSLAASGFDLRSELPLRAALRRDGPDEHVLALVLHHVAADGWSLTPLWRDLAAAYTARRQRCGTADAERPGHHIDHDELPPLPVQYADYTLWQHEVLGDADDPGSAAAAQLAYWRSALDGLPEELALPTDRPRPARQSDAGGAVDVRLPAEVHERLTALAREHSASVFMLLQAAWAATLSRLGAGLDVPIGSPVAGRTDEALDELVGFFVNTLVLRTDVSGDPSFAELVARIRETDLEAYAHQDVPFEQVVDAVAPSRSLARHPLFQVMLAFRTAEMAGGTDMSLPGVEVTVDPASEAVGAKFDLNLDLAENGAGSGAGSGAGIAGSLSYSADLFDEPTARAVADRFARLVDALTADPDRAVGEVDLLGPGEREHLLALGDGGPAVASGTVLDRFATQVATTPDAVAVEDGTRSLSFTDLDDQARSVATALPAGRGDTVAVALPRSVDTVVALLGVLMSGATYVPLDLEHPDARLATIIDEARPVIVIGDPEVGERLGMGVTPMPLGGTESTPITADPAPGDAAYVLFTSGSTGRPKGVVVEHRSLANLVARHDRQIFGRYQPALRVAHTTAVSFDASWDPIAWMICGHRLRIVDDLTRRDPEALVTLIRDEHIDAIETTPSHVGALLEAGLLEGDHRPTVLALGGEAVGPALWARLHGVTALNLYGPTETTVDAVTAEIRQHERPVIGRPIAGMDAYVLDERLTPVPSGSWGELYLAGAGLARGYLNQPAQTAERFVADPFTVDGQRMYRTGDLARWTNDDELEFAGRVDDQVKVRGFRIELGEVETALVEHPDVTRAAPVVVGERLVAYVVGRDGADVDVDVAAVLDHAAARLPGYMVPASVTVLDALPLTVHGKLDRTALPEPDAGAGGRAPAGPVEAVLCTVFAEVTGAPEVGPDDDFFALGGHSLIATRLVHRVREETGAEVPLRALFEAPTVAALAARIDERDETGPALGTIPRPARLPLSAAQERLWFLDRLEDAGAAYHLPAAVRIDGPLDVHALRAALGDVVDRHEVLRTVLPEDDDGPRQEILDAGDLDLLVVDARDDTDDDLDATVRAIAAHPFDLATEPPLRARLVTRGAREHVLVLVLHHIAADGWSLGPLTRDLAAAYRARRNEAAPDLPPMPVQYADYALWQRAHPADPGYWAERLAGAPEELDLPTDRPRPAEPSHRGGEVPTGLGADTHRALCAVARAHGASVFMVLQAAVAATLSRLGAGTDLPIGSPVAGRTDEALDELVGFFVNTLVLRTDLSGDPSFTELVARVRETDLEAYAHQDVPFEEVVDAVAPSRSLARHPLFQVMLALTTAGRTELDLAGTRTEVTPVGTDGVKFDLSWSFTEIHDDDDEAAGLEGTLEYSADLFDEATAARIAERVERLLVAVLAEPDRAVGEVDLLGPGEREHLLALGDGGPPAPFPAEPCREDTVAGGSGTAAAEPCRGDTVGVAGAASSGTILDRFAVQVVATPGAVAVEDGSRSLTFAELDDRARRLASSLSAGRGDAVAVALPRSVDTVVALLGVLLSGATYVPLDLEHPNARLAAILNEARPVTVIADPEDVASLAVDAGDVTSLASTARSSPSLTSRPAPGDAAYVIFTSGSTGRPKGVVVEHGALANLVADHEREIVGDYEPLRVAHTTAVSFDASWDPIAWMVCGHRLRMVDDETRRDPEALVALVRDEHVEAMTVTPSLAAALLDAGLETRVLQVGGEAVPSGLWTRLNEAGVRAVNLYGPTEATVDAVTAEVGRHERPVIGRPIAGVSAHVLDATLNPVPVGTRGELYLAGAGLARGYLNQPAQTAERFVAAADGTRMYRTGDLARWNHDDELEFAGRVDDQVKVRGFRIELGEVETALAEHPDVTRAAPLVETDASGAGRLVAYLTGDAPDPRAVRAFAAERLADYMVPTAFAVVDTLPVTVNGKLDRAALPPAAPVTGGEGAAARTPREHALAGLFAEVTGAARVGVDDSFFDLGGHSMLATRLVQRVRDELDVELPVRALFEAPTVAALARRIDDGDDGAAAFGAHLPLRTAGDRTPVVALPPASGIAWGFAGLLPYLPADQPLHGLQARGMAPGDDLPQTADALVDDYVARVRAVAAPGPYRLIGWSFGGVVAHRVVARLEADGEQVERLILLDAPPRVQHPPAAMLEVFLTNHDVVVDDADRPLDAERAAALLRRAGDPLGALDAASIDAAARAYSRAAGLLADADPAPVMSCDVEFVTATRTAVEGEPLARRWSRSTTGRVRDHPVDTVHEHLMSPATLEELGPLVARLLEDTDQGA